MNRSNVGNQVANGMQVLSVGTFTGSNYLKQAKRQKLADASSALNNMNSDELKQVGQMRADELREQVRQHDNKTNAMEHLSNDEQQAYGNKKAEDLRSYINGNDENEEKTSVDELVSGLKTMDSPQSKDLSSAIKRNSEYLKSRNLTRGSNGRFVSAKKEKQEEDK